MPSRRTRRNLQRFGLPGAALLAAGVGWMLTRSEEAPPPPAPAQEAPVKAVDQRPANPPPSAQAPAPRGGKAPGRPVAPGIGVWTEEAPEVGSHAAEGALCPGCDIVVITMCSLRRDHVDAWEDALPGLTPAMRSLAEDGFRFDTAYSTSNFTLASLTSILTGKFGSSTGVTGWDKGLVEDIPTLPQILGYYGYRTGGFTVDAGSGFRPDYGITRGFQHMEIITPPPDAPDGPRNGHPKEPGGKSAAPPAKWLKAQDDSKPIFAMFHSRTAHYPFVISDVGLDRDETGITRLLWEAGRTQQGVPEAGGPMPGMAGGTSHKGVAVIQGPDPVHTGVREAGKEGLDMFKKRYTEAVKRADRDVGVLLEAIKERGRWDKTIVLVVADHGESLGDHGELLHGDGYYDNVVRVPLLMRVPGLKGGEIDALVSQVDILPTLLSLVGAMPPADIDGVSALPLLTGESDTIRGSSLVEGGVALQKGPEMRGAVIAPPWVLIRQDMGCGTRHARPDHSAGPIPCLFNMEEDPGQLTDVAAQEPEVVKQLVTGWDEYRASKARAGVQLELDKAFVDVLQASGYDFR